MKLSAYSKIDPSDGIRFVDMEPTKETLAQAVKEGFGAAQKWLPPRFFYDQKGSTLFDQICQLDEYYPTRTELGILKRAAPDIGHMVGPHAQIVEFGAGSLDKVRILLNNLKKPAGFVALDISGSHLRHAAQSLKLDFPELDIVAIAADYNQNIPLPPPLDAQRFQRLGFFPGSTIGNFSPAAADVFMRHVAKLLGPDAFFILGTDLVKEPKILEAAYDDEKGVTAAFNRNILNRIRRELDSDIVPENFAHRALYNAELSRIEMHLVSKISQNVRVGDRVYAFGEGETIHTENSYKFRLDGVRTMAKKAGFEPVACWRDDRDYFALHLFKVC